MKKKFFAIFACTIFTLALAGCGSKTDPAPETPETSVSADEPDALKPLTADEITQMYAEAEAIFADINTANFDTDPDTVILKDDNTYYKITDERFADFDEFRKYLAQYFTEDCIKNEGLIPEPLFAEGKDGYVYIQAAGRGTDIFYAGCSVGEPVVSEEEIAFDVTAYYTMDEPYDGEIFTETPEEPIDFETETYHFVLVPEDGAWKFDSFHLFY